MNQTKIPDRKIKEERRDALENEIYIIFGSIAVVIAGYDVKEHKIPNTWIIAGIVTAFVIQFCSTGTAGCVKALISMVIPFFLLFPVYVLGMIGAGDVKYFCMFSVLLNEIQVIYMIFYACVLGSIWSLAKMLKRKSVHRRFRYLKEYVVMVMRTPGCKKYYTKKQGYEDTIAFALPIGLSFVLHLGGVY